MVQWLLRVAAVLLLVALSLSIRHKLGRLPRLLADRSFEIGNLERGSTVGANDVDFFLNLYNRDENNQKPFFKDWVWEASWHEPFISLPFTPTISCEPGYSVLMSRFDWLVMPETPWKMVGKEERKKSKHAKLSGCREVLADRWRNGTTDMPNPKSVWAAAHGVHRLISIAEARLSPDDAGERMVVFSGTEMPLSHAFGRDPVQRNATVARLRRYFKRIVFQIKDIKLEHVTVAPMGLCWGYFMLLLPHWIDGARLARSRLARHFIDLETVFSGSITNKTKGVLAPGGMVATWLEDEKIQAHARHYRRLDMLYPPSNSSVQVISDAAESRRQMRAWANSSAARAAGVEFRLVPSADWYSELANYRFLLSPIGSAIQTSKTVEALMVLTVPVIQRMGYDAHDELVRMGFPLVIVEGWPEITTESLEQWWQALGPRLESFRRNCLTVDGFWHIFTGQLAYCT